MHVFTCTSCGNPVYFDNFQCTACSAKLAFLPDARVMGVLVPQRGATDRYTVKGRRGTYRMCANAIEHNACNWAVADGDPSPLCRACRLNGTIPCLADDKAKEAWLRLEAAKRRLVYSLLGLGLPLESRAENPTGGLEFSFLADSDGQKVFTGHNDGLITINVAEADDPFREKMRAKLGESYRTLLGHFRHEIGHYYWNRLVVDGPRVDAFRALFGDEQADYAEAVKRHYEQGAPADYQASFVSAYATMHPWEDWAETWAHYMHMVDALETAGSFGVSLAPKPVGGAKLPDVKTARVDREDFKALVDAFVPLTLALNSLSRSMGHPDTYPFVLSTKALEKLRFVHDTVAEARKAPKQAQPIREVTGAVASASGA